MGNEYLFDPRVLADWLTRRQTGEDYAANQPHEGSARTRPKTQSNQRFARQIANQQTGYCAALCG
jgi:hypothetical protein